MEGAHTEQPGVNVSYQENAAITKARMMPSQEKDTCNLLVGPSKWWWWDWKQDTFE